MVFITLLGPSSPTPSTTIALLQATALASSDYFWFRRAYLRLFQHTLIANVAASSPTTASTSTTVGNMDTFYAISFLRHRSPGDLLCWSRQRMPGIGNTDVSTGLANPMRCLVYNGFDNITFGIDTILTTTQSRPGFLQGASLHPGLHGAS